MSYSAWEPYDSFGGTPVDTFFSQGSQFQQAKQNFMPASRTPDQNPMAGTNNSYPVMQSKKMDVIDQQAVQQQPVQQVQQQPKETSVKVPPAPAQGPSKWADISDYYQVNDYVYIAIAVLIVDVFVMFLVRYFPDVFGKSINIWYNRFKLSAVISDVLIIVLGFGIARYIYTEYIYPNYDWNPTYFTGLSVVVQIIHDVLFYFGVIKQVPQGHNGMIDVFKDYAASGGAKVIGADSAMMVGSSILSMLLKTAPAHITAFIGILSVYIVPYILETKNEYSGAV
jgi:hypothetical protein